MNNINPELMRLTVQGLYRRWCLLEPEKYLLTQQGENHGLRQY